MKQRILSLTAIATVMSASAFAAELPSIKSAPSHAIDDMDRSLRWFEYWP